jgi:hypothetical protein
MTTSSTPPISADALYAGTPGAAPAPTPTPAPAPAADSAAPAPVATDQQSTTAPAADPKLAGDPAPQPKDGDPAPAPTTRTAADYTFDLPEGFQADEPLLGKFRDLAAEANLDPAVAQKLQGLYIEAAQAQATRLQTEWNNIVTGWHTEVMQMPEFAQDRREQTIGMIGRVLDEFSTPEDRADMDAKGVGNYPPFVRLVVRLSEALLEGDPTPQGNPTQNPGGKSGRPRSLGSAIYGDN